MYAPAIADKLEPGPPASALRAHGISTSFTTKPTFAFAGITFRQQLTLFPLFTHKPREYLGWEALLGSDREHPVRWER